MTIFRRLRRILLVLMVFLAGNVFLRSRASGISVGIGTWVLPRIILSDADPTKQKRTFPGDQGQRASASSACVPIVAAGYRPR